jgi:hypothetical protein
MMTVAFAIASIAPLEAQDACAALAGASVIAEDGTYLGKVDNQYAAESIFNEYGSYGSKYATPSIWNKYGNYGGTYSTQSPFNQYSATPPALVRSGKVLAYLTVNRATKGAISPFALKTCAF